MYILLAEDEKELSKALVTVLEKNHYTVDAVYNGRDALDYAKAEEYDGIILDIMMPYMDGIEVLKKIRGSGKNTPVILLTAKSDVSDRVYGLDMGADDYLPKPFAVAELLARLRSVTRRKGEIISDSPGFGDIILDIEKAKLICGENSERLTNKELKVMEVFIKNPTSLISAEKLLNKVWGGMSDVEINVVWVTVSSIRKKLEKLESGVVITAVRGVGYTLETADRG